ncbi:lipopolysaccharide biosynthesis protein [Clostridium pasteurianum]|uniref:Na+-driven multidrug efflux pump n=1 Tax=Clostridium pasteurianum BC1 TaxID=86416 RepID=R4JZY9_CLOPA|nr:MATE family efflux transporter [Clostridium pasteurianum]AGK95888.1 Na+-driven multidrug efflux pump [Clostridium pasteurianum BC1]
MKNKQLSINMIANIFAFVVNIGINFFFTPYLIKTIGKEAYSFFPLSTNFIGYVNIITVALDSMASRFITIKIHENDNEQANRYFNSVLIANTVLALLVTVPSIVFVLFMNKILHVPIAILRDVKFLFGFVFFGMILSILTSVFGIATFAKNRLDLSSKRNIESNFIRVISLIFMFSLFRPSVSYVGVANLIVIIFILFTNIYYTKKLLPKVTIHKKYFDFKAIKVLLSSGVWNSVNQLSMVLLTSLDLLIANIFINATAAGEYSIVKTVPNFMQQLVGMLVAVFVPQFTILYAQKKHDELLDNINKSIKFMGLLITIPIAFLIIFGDTFFKLWVPSENASKLYLLSNLTIIPMIVTGSINTIFNVYTVTNKLKIPAFVLLITGIINTSVVFILLKTTNLGLLSIPITSFIIGLLRNLIFTPIYAARCLEVRWNTFYKAIARGCICALTMMVLCYVVKHGFNINSWIKLIIAGGVCSIISLIINMFIVFKKEDRNEIMKTIFTLLHIKKIKLKSDESI